MGTNRNGSSSTTTRLLLLLLVVSLSALGQEKAPVKVVHDGGDDVGKLFAYELREALRGSNGMRLVQDDYYAPHIRLSLVSLDSSASGTGRQSAIAIAVTYDSPQMKFLGAHLDTHVHICGRDRTPFCAKSALSTLDKTVSDLRKIDLAIWSSLYTK